VKLTAARRSAIAQNLIADMAAGTANPNPLIEIYAGTIPAAMGGTITDTLIASLTPTATVATESGGVITFDAIAEDTAADATATAGWARILDRDRTEAVYFTVTAIGDGGDLQLGSVNLTAGAAVSITSGVITIGGA
jgi:hypothetical protein